MSHFNARKEGKCEKGTLVIFWNWIEKIEDDPEKPEKIPFIRYYTVFNLAQTEGIEVKEGSACAECNEKAKINFNPITSCEIIITPSFTNWGMLQVTMTDYAGKK